MKASAAVVGIGGALLVALWLLWVAGDPTGDILLFFLLVFAPLLTAVGLVVAAFRRPDVFGRLGQAGAIVVLVGTLGALDVIGLGLAVIGLLLIAWAAADHTTLLSGGAALAVAALVGLALSLERTEGWIHFLPAVALGAFVVACALWRLDRQRDGGEFPRRRRSQAAG